MNAPATPATRRPAADEPSARFRDLLAAEWVKLWSLRSTYGSLALILVATAALSANAALADHRNWPTYSAERRALFHPLRDAFPEQAYLFVMLAAGAIGAVMIVGEYATGLVRVTFAAVPGRSAVVAAKITVLTAVTTAVGTVAATAAFGISQAILSGRDAGYTLHSPGAVQAIAASALLVPVCALVGLGVGALVRHSAPAVVTLFVVLILLPTAVDEDSRWQAAVDHAMPLSAWGHLVDPRPAAAWAPVTHPATTTGAWLVYLVWPLVATVVTLLVVRRREP